MVTGIYGVETKIWEVGGGKTTGYKPRKVEGFVTFVSEVGVLKL